MRSLCAALFLLISLPAAAQDLSALFQEGMEAVEQALVEQDEERRDALLDEAIATFREMLIADPGLVRVRLELARAFFLKREDSLARRHFEAVLAGGVPEPVAANIHAFLAEMRARKRWSFNVGFALAPDTNIGAGSEERTIYIPMFGQPLPFERDAEELTSSGVGVSVWGGAEYQVPVGGAAGRLRAGGDAARREYSGSKFDQVFLGTHLGPRWLMDQNTEGSLLASARQRWIGTVPDNRELGARLEVGRRLTPQVTAFVNASWHDRRYRTESDLDGPVMGRIAQGLVGGDADGAGGPLGGLRAGAAKRERERNEQPLAGRRGHGDRCRLGFTVGGGGEVRWTDFDDEWFPNTPVGEDRADRTRSVRLSVHNRGLTVFGFSPAIVAVHEERETNAQLYDYERTRGELRFVRQF